MPWLPGLADFVTRTSVSAVPDTSLLVQARAAARENESDTPVVPITVRQLEAVVRVAESYARMQLQVRLLLTAPLMSTEKQQCSSWIFPSPRLQQCLLCGCITFVLDGGADQQAACHSVPYRIKHGTLPVIAMLLLSRHG